MDSGIILLFAIVLVVGAILFALITFGKRGGNLDVQKYRVWWLDIEQSIDKNDEKTLRLAILDADSLVDQALRDRGFQGKTMGERLKATRGHLTDRDSIWFAHKLRNRIAHEADTKVSYNQARRALGGFKRALKDLGAI